MTLTCERGKVHPLVTFVDSQHRAFQSLQAAEDYMRTKDVPYSLVIASEFEQTTPKKGAEAFYAVANGTRPGIYPYYKCVRTV